MDKQEKIKILQDIVKIESVNDNEKDVADYLEKLFAQHGIKSEHVENSPTRHNLVAEYQKGEGKVLAISGHEDVVAAGDPADWTYPPFSGHIEGDKLYGRGATDMKSGLAALAIAMIELKEADADLAGTIRFMATVGEEVGALGSTLLAEKGYTKDIDAMLIGEPVDVAAYTHKGSLNFTVIAKGKSAHSSMPQEGVNSISNMAKFITRFDEAFAKVSADYHNEVLGNVAASVTIINGGDQVNSIPAQTTVQGNIRTIPEFDNQKVKDLLQAICDELNQAEGVDLVLRIDYDLNSVLSDKDSGLIKAVLANTDAQPGGISPVTDAAAFTKTDNQFDLVIYGPGVSTLPHQVNEYVSIEDYLTKIDEYKAIISDYLSK
ncbi:succinyl-diaminopimelate desuccinylase [Aerococcus urinaehominis]|uniref:Probable succinyl-diaminopimelate desuccinylase n=1 Tax=Aerococcus urinaehominis TaxID=128944 RepID=A0A0X8FJU4_9LACT|nr:ArgE/DapE family deacylase [Aerococcus urinaehominis]AMB98610.1 succinyl-diaminopimelate desuccinylase [Aerococcus urinaehominis]SDL95160.1 succinyl-diaminopimelate desuccinylase [Aerococcus urinaehominis]